MYRWFFLMAVLLLSACTSVPLSTMLKLRDFDQQQLQTLHGQEIRSRITLPRGVGPDLQKTSLRVTLEFAQGEQQFAFPLEQVSQEELTEGGGLFGKDQLVSRYTMRLSAEGLRQFAQMQQTLQGQSPQNVGLSVSAILARDKRHTQGIMTLELKLSDADPYFVLIDEYAYTVGEPPSD